MCCVCLAERNVSSLFGPSNGTSKKLLGVKQMKLGDIEKCLLYVCLTLLSSSLIFGLCSFGLYMLVCFSFSVLCKKMRR